MTLVTLAYTDNLINLLLHKKESDFVVGQAKLDKGIVDNGIIVDTKKFSKILIHLVRTKLKIRTQVVFQCAISEEKSYIQILQIPLVPEDKIKQAIRWQSKSLLTFDIENVYIDTQVINRTKNSLKVLVTATPKKLINNLIESVKMANYQLESIDTRSGALARLFATIPHELVAISEIHGKKATVILAKNGIARLSSVIELTENGRPFIGKVKELIEYYTSRKEKDKKIGKLFLIGKIDKEDVINWEKSFNLDIIRPTFNNICGLKNSDIDDIFIANFGLEKNPIQKVNLLPQKAIQDYEKNNILLQLRHMFEFMIFLMVVLISINLSLNLGINKRIFNAQDRQLKINQSSFVRSDTQSVKKFGQITDQVKDITIAYQQSATIKAILESKAEGFDLSEINITNNQGTISGSVDNRSTLLKLAKLLEVNKIFKNIIIPVTSYGANTNSPIEIKFESI